MRFKLLARKDPKPSQGTDTVYLRIDHWNDYSYVTMFYLTLHDENGNYHDIGNVKIGFKKQTTETSTFSKIDNEFECLNEDFFSLGTDTDYYKNIYDNLSASFWERMLRSINDVAFNQDTFDDVKEEDVFQTSLLRSVSVASIKGQFANILYGNAPLTDYKFAYKQNQTKKMAGFKLDFSVEENSNPRTNIHAIIGRNGIGKTTLLNGIVDSIVSPEGSVGEVFYRDLWGDEKTVDEDYFSSITSVSFSAFDPFLPPQPTRSSLISRHHYIGLKNIPNKSDELTQEEHEDFYKQFISILKQHSKQQVKKDEWRKAIKILEKDLEKIRSQKDKIILKDRKDLNQETITALKLCFSQQAKKDRWLKAIKTLESDENFLRMDIPRLAEIENHNIFKKKSASLINRMSSGHIIVLLIMTALVASVEEKTLVLIDEPESHLHPPLLSAFIRALSDLLYNRNGVAIIATHSPVVLQEIPKSCVWMLNRRRLSAQPFRPDIETFGENVGILTREVFGLEVTKSGFHKILLELVEDGRSYDEIIEIHQNQLGFEAKALLRAMFISKENKKN